MNSMQKLFLTLVICLFIPIFVSANSDFPTIDNSLGGNGTNGYTGGDGTEGDGGDGGRPSGTASVRNGADGGAGGQGGHGGPGGNGGDAVWTIASDVTNPNTYIITLGGIQGYTGSYGAAGTFAGGDGGGGGFANWASFTGGSNGYGFYWIWDEYPYVIREWTVGNGSDVTGVDGDSGDSSNSDMIYNNGASGGGGGSSGPNGFVQAMSDGGDGGGGLGQEGAYGASGYAGENQATLSSESILLTQSLQLGGRGGKGGKGGNGANGGGGGGGAGGGGSWSAGSGGSGGAAGAAGIKGTGGEVGTGIIQIVNGGALNNLGTIDIKSLSNILILDGGNLTNSIYGIIQNTGELTNQGSLNNDGLIDGSVVNSNTYSGTGSLAGVLTNNGVVSPGTGSQTGTMTIEGLEDNGSLKIQLAGPVGSQLANDILQVNDQFTLTGSTLVLEFVNGLNETNISNGDSYTIVRHPAISDQVFTQIDDSLAPLINGDWEIVYNQPFEDEYSIHLVYSLDPSAVEDNNIPNRFSLKNVYPNPFNPRVTISYELPVASAVNFRIYDVAGRLVWASGMNQVVSAGQHEFLWNGVDQAGRTLPSGSYLLMMNAGQFQTTRRMALVR